MSKYLFLLLSLSLVAGCTKDLRPRMAELEAELDAEKKLVQTLKAEIIEVESKLKKSESDYISLLDSSQKNSEIQQERMAVSDKEKSVIKEELRNANRNALSLKIEKSGLEADVALLNERILAFTKIEDRRRVEADDRRFEAAMKSTLSVQVGLTMKSGDTKAVSNTKVYLTHRKASEYAGDIEVYYNSGGRRGGSVFDVWGAGTGGAKSIFSLVAERADLRLKAEVKFYADTDFNGVATFEEIPKGDYYVICVTPLGGGAVLEKQITISTSKAKVALSNADSL